jgi:hypothetical protein
LDQAEGRFNHPKDVQDVPLRRKLLLQKRKAVWFRRIADGFWQDHKAEQKTACHGGEKHAPDIDILGS